MNTIYRGNDWYKYIWWSEFLNKFPENARTGLNISPGGTQGRNEMLNFVNNRYGYKVHNFFNDMFPNGINVEYKAKEESDTDYLKNFRWSNLKLNQSKTKKFKLRDNTSDDMGMKIYFGYKNSRDKDDNCIYIEWQDERVTGMKISIIKMYGRTGKI